MRIAFDGEDRLECCLCGEYNFDKLLIQKIGIAIAYCGWDYTFCKKCWQGKTLGKEILILLEYPEGLRLKEDELDIKTHE